jgi:hypothetical protein
MILTKKDLRKWEKSAFVLFTAEQERRILDHFGTEPEPYEWTELDISVQIKNFLSCGEFVKPMR